MLERMWGKGNAPPLLVGMQTFTAPLEIHVVISHKIMKQETSRPSNTTCRWVPQGHMLDYVHNSIISNSQNLEAT